MRREFFTNSTHQVILALMGWIVFFAGQAFAQPENLEVSASAGFDGYYRPGSWTPVFVDMSNMPSSGSSLESIEDFEGQLMIATTPRDENGSPVQFIRYVDLPRGSKKRYVLYVKFPESPGQSVPELSLNSENGRRLANFKIDVQHVPKDALLVLNVTETAISLPNFPRLGNRLDPLVSGKISPSQLQEHWAAYDSADLMVFSSWPGTGLSSEQVSAIRDWVSMGGTLVFLTGANTSSYSEPSAAELLPVHISGTGRLEEAGDGSFRLAERGEGVDGRKSYAIAESAPKPGTDVLASADGVPLIAQRKMGNGQLVFFANDLQTSSRLLESHLADAWFSLLPVPNYLAASYELPAVLGQFKTLTGRAARPPNSLLIILICIVYTIIVGPVNFAILGKKKMLEWAWLTVPVIVLVFFVLIYGLGRLTRGGDNIMREMVVEQTRETERVGKTWSVAGTFSSDPGRYYFSPRKQDYILEDPYNWFLPETFKDRNYSSMINPGMSPVSATGSSPLFSYEGETRTVDIRSWPMGVYEAKTFIERGPARNAPPIRSTLMWNRGAIEGSIVNESDVTFEQSWLAVGRDLLELGEMKPNSARRIPLSPLRYRLSRQGTIQKAADSSFTDAVSEFRSLQTRRPDDNTEVNENNAGLLLEALWQPNETGEFLSPMEGRVYFIGLRGLENEETGLLTNFDARIGSRAILSLVELNPAPPSGSEFLVNDIYMHTRMALYDDTVGTNLQVEGHRLALSESAAVFTVELPFSHPGLRVTDIFFNPDFDQEQIRDENIVFAFYRYDRSGAAGRAGWAIMEPGASLRNAGFALPRNGRLYVRVESRKEGEESGGAMAWNARNYVRDLGISMRGVIE